MSQITKEKATQLGQIKLENAAQQFGEERCTEFLAALVATLTPEQLADLYLNVFKLSLISRELLWDLGIPKIYDSLGDVRHQLKMTKEELRPFLTELATE